MALKLLAKLGVEALKPQFVRGNWHPPLISARKAADLKKQFRLEGKEWPVPEVPKPVYKYSHGLKKAPKGHKHDKLAVIRKQKIEENLKAMPQMIAEYRESRKMKDVSFLDKMFMTTRELRKKYLNKQNQNRGKQ